MSRTFAVTSAVLVFGCASSQPPAPAPAAPAAAAHAEHDAHQHHHHHHGAQPLGHRFEQAEKWVPVFEGKDRDAWQRPDVVVQALQLQPGMTVADIGAGTGYFEQYLAPAVGDSGKVIAVDIEPDMIRYLRERYANTPQVEARQATPTSPALEPATVDRILVVNTWHHIPERVAYSKQLASALKPGGFVLVVDFTMETSKGPPRAHRLAPDVVIGELVQAGLSARRLDVELPDQYVIEARR